MGTTLEGVAFCHLCHDWKTERMRRHLLRQRMLHELACNLASQRWKVVEVSR